MTDREIMASMLLTRGDPPDVPQGRTARGVLAARLRATLERRTGCDLAGVQRGLRVSTRPEITLAHDQEVWIRHFHAMLSEFLDAGT